MGCTSCDQQSLPVSTPCLNCGEVVCATPQACVEVFNSECVLHLGEPKECAGEEVYAQGDSLGVINSKIVDYFCGIVKGLDNKTANYPLADTVVFNQFDSINEIAVKIVDWVGDVLTSLGITPTGATIVPILHADLVILRSTSDLIPSQMYLITDFATMYDQPNYLDATTEITTNNFKAAAVDPIVVFAISTNNLATEAWQPAYPNDKLEYTLDYITPVTNTATKGRITKRTDDRNNTCYYDHRTVLFKRYSDASNLPTSYFNKGFGSVERLTFFNSDSANNKIGTNLELSESKLYIFDLPNIVFFNESHENKLNATIENVTFYQETTNVIITGKVQNSLFFNQIINSSFRDVTTISILGGANISEFKVHGSFADSTITASSYFYSNEFKSFTDNIIFAGSMYKNKIDFFSENELLGGKSIHLNEGLSWVNNVLYSDVIENNITKFEDNTDSGVDTAFGFSFNKGLDVSNNTFSNGVLNNDFGFHFQGNTLGDSFGTLAHVGNTFYYVESCDFGNSCLGNTAKMLLLSCTFGNDFRLNEIKIDLTSVDFTSATHVYGDYNCEIYKNSGAVKKLAYIDAFDSRQTVLITD